MGPARAQAVGRTRAFAHFRGPAGERLAHDRLSPQPRRPPLGYLLAPQPDRLPRRCLARNLLSRSPNRSDLAIVHREWRRHGSAPAGDTSVATHKRAENVNIASSLDCACCVHGSVRRITVFGVAPTPTGARPAGNPGTMEGVWTLAPRPRRRHNRGLRTCRPIVASAHREYGR